MIRAQKRKILYLTSALPYHLSKENRFSCLSEFGIGGANIVAWCETDESKFKPVIKFYEKNCGDFELYPMVKTHSSTFLHRLENIKKTIMIGYKIIRDDPRYDAIVCYNPFLPNGLAGVVLKYLTGRKLIIEIMGNVWTAHNHISKNKTSIGKIKGWVQQKMCDFVISKSDHLHILYPDQLPEHLQEKCTYTCFHDYTQIPSFSETKNEYYKKRRVLLFAGFPWYLKGIDVLIKAFNEIYHKYPDVILKIVGYCPDRSEFETLRCNNQQIIFHDPMSHDILLEEMKQCYAFVLPSRTEGLARVLIEASAAKKPIIASNVDGNPFIVKHGVSGLIFDTGDVNDLASKLTYMLDNPDMASFFGKNGFERSKGFTPSEYGFGFRKMLDNVL